MSLGRTLLPIIGPLGIAVALAVVSSLGDDETATPKDRSPVYTEHAPAQPEALPARDRAPAPPPAARPAGPPVDRPRCLASMTVRELGRQLMTIRQVEHIAELYREEAPAEVTRAYLQGLADAAAALPPGVGRSRLLVIAAEGLVGIGHAEPARVALEASRELPPPRPSDFDFERTDWHGHAAQVAARLDDHALAQSLVGEDAEARAELARHYAEAGDPARARALLQQATAPAHEGLGWRLAQASALAGVGEREAALALADQVVRDATLVRLVIARTLARQGHRDEAAAVLRDAAAAMPAPASDDRWSGLGTMVSIADELHEAGQRDEALALLERTRTELRDQGDHLRAVEPWGALIDAEHRMGNTQQAWDDLTTLERISLASMNAAPMVRTLLLTRDGRLAEALAVIHDTAAITYPLAYAHVHARMRQPDATVERELDDGLRIFCPAG